MIIIQNKSVVHRIFLDGGSCFSSPTCSLNDISSVYVGTFKGNIFSLNEVSRASYVWHMYYL